MLHLTYTAPDGKVFHQVTKRVAAKLFDAGHTILALPSNVIPNNVWMAPCPFNKAQFVEDNFAAACDSFAYYNCNSEFGNYIHFFAPTEKN